VVRVSEPPGTPADGLLQRVKAEPRRSRASSAGLVAAVLPSVPREGLGGEGPQPSSVSRYSVYGGHRRILGPQNHETQRWLLHAHGQSHTLSSRPGRISRRSTRRRDQSVSPGSVSYTQTPRSEAWNRVLASFRVSLVADQAVAVMGREPAEMDVGAAGSTPSVFGRTPCVAESCEVAGRISSPC
jgi:hypothetical protein